MARALLILALGLGIVFGSSQPATAKLGLTGATIEGPGISQPIVVHRNDLEDLAGNSGLFTGFWRKACRDSGGCVRRPDHLGPWYTVTYTLRTHETVVQFVYPYASGGPTAYVPAEQPFFRTQRTTGVWFLGALPLRWSLEGIGVPVATDPVAPRATTGVTPEASSAVVWPVALVVCAAILGAADLVRWRRRGSMRQATGVASHP